MKDISELMPLNCKNCKGLIVKPPDIDSKIVHWRYLQNEEIKNIKTIKLYILLPFLSPDRFFYDLNTDAWHRNDLKRILLKGSDDLEFINYLKEHGIVIVECCFCPLHRFFLLGVPFSFMAKVITLCFRRHNLHLLRINKRAPIITLFEESESLGDEVFPELKTRIIKNFELYKLEKSNKRFRKLVDLITLPEKD